MAESLQIEIDTPRLSLRTLRVEDVTQAYADWLNDPEVSRFLSAAHTKHSTKSCRDYVRSYAGQSDRALIGIFAKPSGEHIGNLTLSTVDWRRKVAAVGIGLGKRAYWGKGLAREALTALRDYAFDEMKLHRLEAKVSDRNTRSIHLFLKSGFVIEGNLRDSDLIDGKYHNGYLFGVLECDRR
jgi:RimJ/RimL family protein N-acetyltransferase